MRYGRLISHGDLFVFWGLGWRCLRNLGLLLVSGILSRTSSPGLPTLRAYRVSPKQQASHVAKSFDAKTHPSSCRAIGIERRLGCFFILKRENGLARNSNRLWQLSHVHCTERLSHSCMSFTLAHADLKSHGSC